MSLCKFTLMDLTGGGMEMMDPGQVLESGGVMDTSGMCLRDLVVINAATLQIPVQRLQ